MGNITVSFYLRHFAGFFIQFGGGTVLCLLPFEEEAFRYPRIRVLAGCGGLVLLSSALFPLFMGMPFIGNTPYWSLFANIYMTVTIILFVVVYIRTTRVETIKKLVVLVMTLLYSATQYMLVNIAIPFLTDTPSCEVYPLLDVELYAGTMAVMFPFFALLMKRAVWDYLVEMEIDSIRREFRLVLLISFLFFVMMAFCASGPVGLLAKAWMWIIPPMVMVAVLLTIFYWRFFRESVLRKRENEERKTLEIQKIQYDNIVRDMEQTRILRHDMHHSMNRLSELLAENDVESAKAYLSELTGQIDHRDIVSYCKNTTVNGLLQYYVGMAANWNIQCRVRADCGEVRISPVDLTVLLGNVMENAIHACEQLEGDRWITVEIGVINGSLLIQTVNPCAEVYPSGKYRLDGSFLPAAAYVSGRTGGGFRLHSLERTSQKYGGNASFRFDKKAQTFTTRIRLDLR